LPIALAVALAWAGAAVAQSSVTSTSMPVAVLQTALDRQGFGVGLIDDLDGPRTRGALADYCRSRGLSWEAGRAHLAADSTPAFTAYIVTDADIAQIGAAPEDWLAASEVPAMAYRSLVEVLSEKFHAAPAFLQRLNPGVAAWDPTLVGATLTVPNIAPRAAPPVVVSLEITCDRFRLLAYDTNRTLVASFPCSIALDVTRIPTGEWRVVAFAPDPVYVFDPANFPESARAQEIGRKLILPPGPNNPVGVYWLSLSRPGFGIHGTPQPETIGRPESHGCFRLTNWDIVALARLVAAGTPVRVVSGAPPP
jgi:lipoprotein-anchoring transpeptidase ErfK/SrfK